MMTRSYIILMDYFVEDALRLQDVAPYYDFGFYSGCDSARYLVDFCFPHPLVHSDRAVFCTLPTSERSSSTV